MKYDTGSQLGSQRKSSARNAKLPLNQVRSVSWSIVSNVALIFGYTGIAI